MTDLNRMLAELRELSPDAPTERQVERSIHQGNRRYRRQKRTRAVAAVLAVLVVAAGSAGLVQRWRAPQTVTLADGSTLVPLARDSKVVVREPAPGVVEVAMERGATRFDVVHNPKRRFSVTAGNVRIDVIGTQFVVSMNADDVNVRVEHGRVRVTAGDVARVVSQGESAGFPRRVELTAATREPGAEPETLAPPEAQSAGEPLRLPEVPLVDTRRPGDATRRKVDGSGSAWRASAARGDYDEAYGVLHASGAGAVRDVAEELMLAADVARWSHHPAEAVPYLEQVLREHASDPRSQLAAFTLGRVLLEELGRPREAANAFARARTLDVNGPLSGDALAREVEAWSRAGDTSQALARAQEYLSRYPNGPHAASVRRFGRLE